MAWLDEQLAALATQSPAQLRAQWRQLYRASPPAFTPDLLRRGIAYRLQEKRHGGLPASVERDLRRLEADLHKTGHLREPAPRLKPGTRLVRSWQGTTHVVQVVEAGYDYAGQRYSSLTPIARAITGTHWSGPRFFGVKARPAPPRRGRSNG